MYQGWYISDEGEGKKAEAMHPVLFFVFFYFPSNEGRRQRRRCVEGDV